MMKDSCQKHFPLNKQNSCILCELNHIRGLCFLSYLSVLRAFASPMAVVQWYSVTVVVQCYSFTVVVCYSGTVVQWYSVTVVVCYSGTVVQWCSGTVVQW